MSEDKQCIRSPMMLDGLNKFISFFNQRQIEEAVWVFAELGIADLLASLDARSAEEICVQTGWQDAIKLRRVLYVSTVAGLVEIEHDGRFRLTPTGHLLVINHPSRARDFVLTLLSPNNDSCIPKLIREGKHMMKSETNGITRQYTELSSEMVTAFASAMSTYSHNTGSIIAKVVDAFSRCNTLVDIGGSCGTLLAYILAMHTNIVNGIVFDLPSVVAQATSSIDINDFARFGISPSRYRFIAGDIFDTNTIPQADAYMLKYILHNMSDESSIKALKSLCQAARRPAMVFIIERVLDEPKSSNALRRQWTAYAEDFVMLGTDEGCERTLSEYVSLLERAGLIFYKLYESGVDEQIIESHIN